MAAPSSLICTDPTNIDALLLLSCFLSSSASWSFTDKSCTSLVTLSIFTSISTESAALGFAPAPVSAVGTRGGGCRRAPLEVVTVTFGNGMACGFTGTAGAAGGGGSTGSTTGCRNMLAPLKRTCVGAAAVGTGAEGAGVSSWVALNRTRLPSPTGAGTVIGGEEDAETPEIGVGMEDTLIVEEGPALI